MERNTTTSPVIVNQKKTKTMEIKDALEYAQVFKKAIVRSNMWGLNRLGATAHENSIPKVVMNSESSKQFMLILLNTFIDVQNSLTKSLNEKESSAAEKIKKMLVAKAKEDEALRDAYRELAEERAHNFVQQWQDQHDNDGEHLIDFGPTNKGTKKRTVKIDPAGETPVDDDPEESEEGVPQIVINIDELNINLNGDV